MVYECIFFVLCMIKRRQFFNQTWEPVCLGPKMLPILICTLFKTEQVLMGWASNLWHTMTHSDIPCQHTVAGMVSVHTKINGLIFYIYQKFLMQRLESMSRDNQHVSMNFMQSSITNLYALYHVANRGSNNTSMFIITCSVNLLALC